MAVTRLERKGRKNKSRAKARVQRIKHLNEAPVVKNVDVEAIKAEFAKKSADPAKNADVEVEAPKEEVQVAAKVEKVEAVVEEPKAEAVEEKPKAKKAAKKKTDEEE